FREDPTALPPVDITPELEQDLQQARTAQIMPPGAVPGAEVYGASADLAHNREAPPPEGMGEEPESEAPEVYGAAATLNKERASPPPRERRPPREDY
ncbi:MAG TPA: hypothetical protein VNZ52_05625, partial [Candidatus Thermoplasmatota archaeon]|nr:hypothetical protein [Candidatus Thermoplasmatota archaeon]